MEAEIGDEIIVGSTGPGRAGRVGTIIGLSAADGSPRYLVHWLTGDYDAMISPGPGTQIKVCHRRHAAPWQGPDFGPEATD